MSITIKLIEYKGWKDCVHITNGIVEMIVPTQIGPRILHFGFTGSGNVLYEFERESGLTGGDDWHLFGGHRLWAGPQVRLRPNEPENSAVGYTINEDGITLTADTQKESKIQKQMRIRMFEGEAHVSIEHTIISWCVWPIELTVWPVTVVSAKGRAVWSTQAKDTFYLPNASLAYWPWTKRNDARFTIGENYMWLQPDISNKEWFKVGVPNESGWAAYFFENQMFVKKYSYDSTANYADFGSSLEIFCNEEFLEIESTSPLTLLEKGEQCSHTEEWFLFNNVECPENENEMSMVIKNEEI